MSGQPDIVVTDIVMPEREGLETIMAIKSARPDVPILAISGGGRIGAPPFLDLARRLGADDVLAKPFRTAQLVERIAALVSPVSGVMPATTARR
jgi:CheY-like chemotaxis protein